MVVLASRSQYADHLEPVTSLLPELPEDVAIVASYADTHTAIRGGYRRIVRMEHGVGQSFTIPHPHYPGGDGNEEVGLFLTPNEHSAERWHHRYPHTPVEIVGSPFAESLPGRDVGGPVTIGFAFHWNLFLVPETRSALPYYRSAIADVADTFATVITGHPRARQPAQVAEKADVPYIAAFPDFCRTVDVLVADATSVLYEFAATGRPVVVLDAPWYRRDVNHGLRFWDAADVGPRVSHPGDVIPAIHRALDGREGDIERRETALDIVFTHRSGSAERAAGVIRDWIAA